MSVIYISFASNLCTLQSYLFTYVLCAIHWTNERHGITDERSFAARLGAHHVRTSYTLKIEDAEKKNISLIHVIVQDYVQDSKWSTLKLCQFSK
jgi:hypothetical protein